MRQIDNRASYTPAIILFALSFLVTALFSASLKIFFDSQSWAEVLLKGLLIPCFTWTALLILSTLAFERERRIIFWTQLGLVCLLGSAALLPAAALNLLLRQPPLLASALNVLFSVALMGVVLYRRLRCHGFSRNWTYGWCGLILLNMSFYLLSVVL